VSFLENFSEFSIISMNFHSALRRGLSACLLRDAPGRLRHQVSRLDPVDRSEEATAVEQRGQPQLDDDERVALRRLHVGCQCEGAAGHGRRGTVNAASAILVARVESNSNGRDGSKIEDDLGADELQPRVA
jgi:hypothetical protein